MAIQHTSHACCHLILVFDNGVIVIAISKSTHCHDQVNTLP